MGNNCCEQLQNDQQKIVIQVANKKGIEYEQKSARVSSSQNSLTEPIKKMDIFHNPQIRMGQVIKQPQINSKIQSYIQTLNPFAQKLNPNSPTISLGNKVYKGQVNQAGLPNGYGKMYYKNGTLLIGRFQNGVANGQTHYIWPDGSYYRGQVVNNKANDDYAIYQCEDYRYNGSIKNNAFNGEGTILTSNDKYKFNGVFIQGQKKKGKLTWKQAQVKSLPLSSSQVQYWEEYTYEGQFDQNQNFTGLGRLTTPKGIYTGQFKNGMKNGKGVFEYVNGLKYDGYYKDDVKEGTGAIIGKNKNVAFEGQIKNGLPNGKGKAPGPDGLLYEVNWNNGISSTVIESEIKS